MDTIVEQRPVITADAAGRGSLARRATARQLLRFGTVGALNTTIDVAALNVLVWALALRTTPELLVANAVAYGLGAVNSFLLNRRWTFGRRGPGTAGEAWRFAATTAAGIALNDALLWLLSRALLPLLGPTALWANAAKLGAIGGSVLISYLGMRLWVFAQGGPARPQPVDSPRNR
ncbi:MAG TPA: GtrA family protein [Thermomicrobiaceae bacterium]|nr:GtrA family protein [Thermomicrobiaceae bacterium]